MRHHRGPVRGAGSRPRFKCAHGSRDAVHIAGGRVGNGHRARPAGQFDLSVEAVEPIVMEFLEERGIEIRDLPPAKQATRLALSAAHRYRAGRRGLNLGDYLHYACAKYHRTPILATGNEFRETDLETVP